MRNSAGPDDAPDTAPDQHARPRHVAPLRTANDRTARLGLERPPATAEFHTRPLGGGELAADLAQRRLDRDEGIDHVGIELPLSLREDLGMRSAPAHGAAVGSVTRHGVERIGDREDARTEWDLVADEAVRISTPVPAFVVRAHDLEPFALEEDD